MSAAPILHATFTIDRAFRVAAERAFRFWAERDLKARWTECHPDWRVLADEFDFRPGGREAKRWATAEGGEQTITATYLDIAAPHRIIYAFEMSLDGTRISASLASIELRPAGSGTAMHYTEQIAFLGSESMLAARIAGTGSGFDRLVSLTVPGTAASA